MRVTGAFLAESASVVDGKLNVQGGFVRIYLVGPDRLVDVHLVVLAGFEAGDSNPKLAIELTMPSGDSQTMSVDMPWTPDDSVDEDLGFASWPLLIPAESDGVYRLVLSSDADPVTLTLTVVSGG